MATQQKIAHMPKKAKKKPILLLFLILLLVLAAIVLLSNELLTIKRIDVLGNVTKSNDEIIKIAEISLGQKLFKVSASKVSKNINKLPELEVVSVKIDIPDKVTITVEERAPFAYVENMGYFIMLDKQANVLSFSTRLNEQYSNLIQIYGMSVTGYTPGKPLGTDDDYQLDALKNVMASLYEKHYSEYAIINMINPINISLETGDGFSTVVGEDVDLDKKLDAAQKIIEEFKSEGEKGGVVNISSLTSITFIKNGASAIEDEKNVD